MIFENVLPRLLEAIEKANESDEPQEIKFIYNEILNQYSMNPVFEYLFFNGHDFCTRHDEFRFVVIIQPENKKP